VGHSEVSQQLGMLSLHGLGGETVTVGFKDHNSDEEDDDFEIKVNAAAADFRNRSTGNMVTTSLRLHLLLFLTVWSRWADCRGNSRPKGCCGRKRETSCAAGRFDEAQARRRQLGAEVRMKSECRWCITRYSSWPHLFLPCHSARRPKKLPGDEYKSEKAGGDVWRKGSVQPYAYIPLDPKMFSKKYGLVALSSLLCFESATFSLTDTHYFHFLFCTCARQSRNAQEQYGHVVQSKRGGNKKGGRGRR
jgi:hypothetical protein